MKVEGLDQKKNAPVFARKLGEKPFSKKHPQCTRPGSNPDLPVIGKRRDIMMYSHIIDFQPIFASAGCQLPTLQWRIDLMHSVCLYSDYWVSVLHKMLIGRSVLATQLSRGNKTHLHLYAHCANTVEHPCGTVGYELGAVALFGVNLMDSAVRVVVKAEAWGGQAEGEVHQYVVTAGVGGGDPLRSRVKGVYISDKFRVPGNVPCHDTGSYKELNEGSSERQTPGTGFGRETPGAVAVHPATGSISHRHSASIFHRILGGPRCEGETLRVAAASRSESRSL
ncbi:unnamed protein product [Timema podura]|uniref:Uncharacterized protein n=1 Tax=Timema podura TaxID=61482 RepID=A0ABN7NEA6_TIMPD|nr:unnamed protein product [Timema podura]